MKITDLLKEEIDELFLHHKNIHRILKHFKLNSNGSGNYRTFKKHCRELGVIIPEYKNEGNCYFFLTKKPIDYFLKENTTCNRSNLKNRLINENILDYKCNICGIENWNDKKISLHLDHINGINNDNRLENLRLLCPNCHSQTETYAGRNSKKIYYCECGRKKHKDSPICNYCSNILQRKVQRPPYEELIKEVALNGYSATGRKYGVSDNGIRKWIKKPY